MATGGVSKTEVQKARRALLAKGVNPSIDAVRVELGNTGSKSTIHRYLKQLEEEEGQGPGAQVAVSDAIQDLVGRLAARLHEEADAIVADAQQRFIAQLQERTAALERVQQDAIAVSQQLQRTEIALHDERAAHVALQAATGEKAAEIVQLTERLAGMSVRLADHEAHAQSLEEKHAHARDALAHFRASVREQREQEQQRHAHQIQELQLALRQANQALGAKNEEVLRLNRENSQWLERHAHDEREFRNLRQAHEAQQRELDALRQTAVDHQALQERWTRDVEALEAARDHLARAEAIALQERQRREESDIEVMRATARLEALQPLVARLTQREVPTENKPD